MLTFLCVFFSVLGLARSAGDRPVIGIVSQPVDDTCNSLSRQGRISRFAVLAEDRGYQRCNTSFVTASYVKWLESAGARVAVIPWDISPLDLSPLLGSLNGVIFSGGDLNLAPGEPYFDTASRIYKIATQFNQQGQYFPLWGTCQGFQLLSILGAGSNTTVLQDGFDSENLNLALDLTPSAPSSRILSQAPPQVVSELTGKNCTCNLHHMGVDPSLYSSNPVLSKSFRLISSNVDRKGRPFGSMMEGFSMPFYGTQFHPERNAFEYYPPNLDKSRAAMEAMQYLAQFFVNEARKSSFSFKSREDEQKVSIYNYAQFASFTLDPTPGDFYDEQMYVFPTSYRPM